jgi:redox-sensitive bicupin YhaK (pirin superfamily)
MAHVRPILKIVTGTGATDGAGVELVRVIGRNDVAEFDPFLMLDAFDSDNPEDYIRGFPWHPHRGIETVTYLIAGDVAHGDSLGNHGHIRDGGCQWMTAGSGIIHQEMPQTSPRMLGLQLWLNLPQKDKLAPPHYRDLSGDKIPRVREKGARIGVISGCFGETVGPTQGDYVKATVLDVELEPGADIRLPVAAGKTLFIYIVAGVGHFGGAEKAVASRRAVLFGAGDVFEAWAGASGLHFVLFAGRPLHEPIAWGGPIVMNTQEELQQAFKEIDNGTFIRSPEPKP